MRRLIAATIATALLGGCEKAVDPAALARKEARDIALVEAAQRSNPPPRAINPEGITSAEISSNRLSASACQFRAIETPLADPILLADERRAFMQLEGRLITLAADPGSERAHAMLFRHYVGKSHSLTVDRSPGDGDRLGDDRLRWPARVTIRDAWDQTVFVATGELACG